MLNLNGAFKTLGIFLLISMFSLMNAYSQENTYTVSIGAFPWSDRMGEWEIAVIPPKYVSDKPILRQLCGAKTLVLPSEGLKIVVIAVLEKQLKEFTDKYPAMKDSGDNMQIKRGASTLDYAIVIYQNPPKETKFDFAAAGIILLSAGNDTAATVVPVSGNSAVVTPVAVKPEPKTQPIISGNTYTVSIGAFPWSDRMGEWEIAVIPPKYVSDKPVLRQLCGAKTLVLPSEGLKIVVIAVLEKQLKEFTDKYPAMKDSGDNMQIKRGASTLDYAIVIYQNPPKETKFDFAAAGIILLSAGNDTAATVVPVSGNSAVAAAVKPEPKAQPASSAAKILVQSQEFEAQEWPLKPGKRMVKMWVEEPPAGINKNTGLMLVLHNWGGVYNSPEYIQWCKTFAARYNVVAISVNYLQSGLDWKETKPYDHGFLQAMDVIGALYTVRGQIKAQGLEFNENRIYSMGGSGGGNVTQMAMKLAPHTFACGVDICGMPGLIDAIAFGTGDGTNLNAGYSRDPQSPAFLTKDMQEIRDFGNPLHCRILHAANPKLKIVIVHGAGDKTCPLLPKITQYRNMLESGISVDAHFITEFDVDGSIIKDTGHAVGNREQIVVKFADVYMKENGTFAKSLSAPNNFSRKGKVEYPTSNGKYVIDYSSYPTISFEAK